MCCTLNEEPTTRPADRRNHSPAKPQTAVTLTPHAALAQAHDDGHPIETIAAWAVPPVSGNTVRRACYGHRLDPRTVARFARSPVAPRWVAEVMVAALQPVPVPATPLAPKYTDPNSDGVSDLKDIPHVAARKALADAGAVATLIHLTADGKFDESDAARMAPLQEESANWGEALRRFAMTGTAQG